MKKNESQRPGKWKLSTASSTAIDLVKNNFLKKLIILVEI